MLGSIPPDPVWLHFANDIAICNLILPRMQKV